MRKDEYKNIFNSEKKHWWYLGMERISRSLLEKYSQRSQTNKILDAGCGTGGMMVALKKYGEVYGIDKSEEAIKLCKERELENISLGSIENLPFKEETFDIITCFDVLYHQWISDDNKALQEFNRVLKNDGLLLVRVPAYSFLKGSHDQVVLTKRRFTKRSITKEISDTNFKVIKATYANMFLFPILLLKRVLERFIRSNEQSDVNIPNKLINNLLLWILLLENILISNFNLPFGSSIFVIAKKI